MRSSRIVTMIGLICLASSAVAGPLDIPDLRLWLDAGQNVTKDGSDLVSSWGDITGVTNNTVAQNVEEADPNQQPLWVASAIGGKPAIRFDGFNDGLSNHLDNLLGSGTDRTIFVVGQASTGDAQDDGLGGSLVVIRRDSFVGTQTFFNAQIYDNSGWDAFDELCCGTDNPTAVYTDGIAVNDVVSASVFPISTVTQPFVSEHRVANLSLNFSVNAADIPIQRLFTNQRPAPVTPENSTAIGFEIGERDDKGSQHWEGDIAEILIYERSLTSGERQSIYTYLGEKYGLTLAPIGVPGDYNGNGTVDAADYTVWRDTLNSTSDLRANGDNSAASEGVIDNADYLFWKSHFGNAGSGAGSVGSVVPEPVSATTIFGAVLSMFGCGLRSISIGRKRDSR